MLTTLLFLILGVLWGSTWLLHAQTYSALPLLAAGALRFALAAVLLGAAALLRRAFRKKTGTEKTSFWRSSAVLGLLLLALPYACSAGASHAGVAAGLPGAMYAAMPLAVLLFLEEEMASRLPALLLGLTGVSLLVIQGLDLDAIHWRGEVLLLAGMAANAGALAYAMRGGLRRLQEAASLAGCAAQCAVAAGVLAFFAAISGQWFALGHELANQVISLRGILWPAVTSEAMISSITLPMMYLLLRRAGAVQVAAVQWLVTLAGAAEAAWFLGFRPVWENWAGLGLTLVAMGLVLRESQPGQRKII